MPLELRRQRDGRLRDTWYGRYEINGKLLRPNLDIKVAGNPPESLSLRDEGDTAFERSRALAEAKLDGIIAEARSKASATRIVEKLYEAKTGETLQTITLGELHTEWANIARKRDPNERYAAQCVSTLKRFARFIQTENPKAVEIAQVSRPAARTFLNAESERGVTAKTWNDTLKLLRATFKHLLPDGAFNPFADIPTRETQTVFRKPFTPKELRRIMDTARADDFIRPIIATGICTAMRRGDCCLLKWSDVDLERRFITVKTNKTGQTVSIPIFPLLYDQLAPGRGEGKEYVFPSQAAMYLENPDGITWRVKKVLAVALGNAKADLPKLPEVSAKEARQRGLDYIAKLPDSDKKTRMTAVFEHYMDGKKTCEVTVAAGVSKGSASNYLNEIESHVKCQIVRGRPEGGSLTAALKTDTSLLRTEREDGTRNASVRDFHSFRVTWVTLALTAGVPLELVQKVTGHKTTDIVLKHYFQPGREAFRQALHAVMPGLLTNGKTKTPAEKVADIAAKSTEKTALRDIQAIKKILAAQAAPDQPKERSQLPPAQQK